MQRSDHMALFRWWPNNTSFVLYCVLRALLPVTGIHMARPSMHIHCCNCCKGFSSLTRVQPAAAKHQLRLTLRAEGPACVLPLEELSLHCSLSSAALLPNLSLRDRCIPLTPGCPGPCPLPSALPAAAAAPRAALPLPLAPDRPRPWLLELPNGLSCNRSTCTKPLPPVALLRWWWPPLAKLLLLPSPPLLLPSAPACRCRWGLQALLLLPLGRSSLRLVVSSVETPWEALLLRGCWL